MRLPQTDFVPLDVTPCARMWDVFSPENSVWAVQVTAVCHQLHRRPLCSAQLLMAVLKLLTAPERQQNRLPPLPTRVHSLFLNPHSPQLQINITQSSLMVHSVRRATDLSTFHHCHSHSETCHGLNIMDLPMLEYTGRRFPGKCWACQVECS